MRMLLGAALSVVVTLVTCIAGNSRAAEYRLVDLSDFLPTDINNHGQIVGNAPLTSFSSFAGLLQSNDYHAEPIDVGFQADEFRLIAINSMGQIADGGAYRQSLWTPATPNGSSGSVTLIPGGELLLTENPRTADIGDDGTLLINTWDFSGGGGFKSYLWKPSTPNGSVGVMSAFGGGGGTDVTVSCINSLGNITGTDANGAFVFIPTTANGVDGAQHTLSNDAMGMASYSKEINDKGQIVGSIVVGTRQHAMLWNPAQINGPSGVMQDLGLLPGRLQSYALDINNSGTVIGFADDNSTTHISSENTRNGLSFLWTLSGGMQSLADLVDASGNDWKSLGVHGINDLGQIVGQGIYDPDGDGGVPAEVRGFLLNPVPEPTTIGLSLVVFIGCMTRKLLRRS